MVRSSRHEHDVTRIRHGLVKRAAATAAATTTTVTTAIAAATAMPMSLQAKAWR